MKNHEEETKVDETIRGSLVILVFRLFLALLLIEVVYAAVYYFLSIQFNIPYDWHHHVSFGLFLLLSLKLVAQAYLIILVTLSWANRAYLLTVKHLVTREGVFSLKENIHDFDNIDSISINQSFLGRLFNFGDISINSDKEDSNRSMIGIPNPRKYERLLKNCISQNRFTQRNRGKDSDELL